MVVKTLLKTNFWTCCWNTRVQDKSFPLIKLVLADRGGQGHHGLGEPQEKSPTRLTATRRTWTWRRRRRRTEWNWSDRKCSSTSYHFSPQIFRIRNKRCFGHVLGLKSLIFWSTDYNVLSNELRISDLWTMMWYNQYDNLIIMIIWFVQNCLCW